METEQRYKIAFVIVKSNLQTVLEVVDGVAIGPIRFEAVEAKPIEPELPPASPKAKQNGSRQHHAIRRRNVDGKSADYHLLGWMKSGKPGGIWTNRAIRKNLRGIGINGNSTGPSILSRGIKTGHVERIGVGTYRLTQLGWNAPIEEVVKAIKNQKPSGSRVELSY